MTISEITTEIERLLTLVEPLISADEYTHLKGNYYKSGDSMVKKLMDNVDLLISMQSDVIAIERTTPRVGARLVTSGETNGN